MESQFRLNWTVLVEEAKQRRKSQKLTQKRLGMLAKVSTPTVSRFENDEKDIQLSSALRILGILGLIDQRNLLFTELKPFYDPNREVVIFFGHDAEKKIQCGISREALEDHFHNNLNKANFDPIKQFINNHTAIEQLARRKYLANRFESDGTVLITTSDL